MTQVLRYPYEAITDTTDYLQITISKYQPASGAVAGKEFITNADTGIIRTNTLNNADAVNVSETRPITDKNIQSLTQGGVILLPMPSNIQDGNSVNYGDDTLDTITGKIFGGASNVMGTQYNGSDPKKTVQDNVKEFQTTLSDNAYIAAKSILNSDLKTIAMKSLASQATSIFGGNVTINQVLARENGQILNPNMELLFNGVTLRTFRFSFKMTPRDDKESDQIKYIIRSLKTNMAAKSGGKVGKVGGTFLTTPNIFELTYRKGNNNHPFLHKFKPCALTDMAVNYTGENVYATYGDGTPVSMTMDLTFKELVPIYDNDYLDSDTTVGY
jgi:hypothetical protein